jgi:hypothetical protein
MRLVLVFAAVAFSACALSGGSSERQLAVIDFGGGSDTVVFVVPDTVLKSTPFEVTVRTYGGGCVKQGDTEVSLTANVAEVRPFDSFPVGRQSCTLILRLFTHRATLQFNAAGSSTVRVRGRRQAGNADTIVVRERSVVVR